MDWNGLMSPKQLDWWNYRQDWDAIYYRQGGFLIYSMVLVVSRWECRNSS